MNRSLFLTALLLAAPTLAAAQPQAPAPVRIRGTIVAVDGPTLTVKDPLSERKVVLADNARIAYILPTQIAKITAGSLIGSASLPQPDGSLRAIEVHVLPPGVAPRIGPWDLQPNSLMANGNVKTATSETVDKVEGRVLTIDVGGTEKRLFVPAGVPVVTYEPADRSALTPGAKVVILSAVRRDDGTFTTSSISVGKDGLTPPM